MPKYINTTENYFSLSIYSDLIESFLDTMQKTGILYISHTVVCDFFVVTIFVVRKLTKNFTRKLFINRNIYGK